VQLQDYASSYQSKTDEELRLLASDLEDLIPEARLALEGELSRRKITVPGNLTSDSDDKGTTSESGPELIGPPQSAGRFVGEVLDLYQSHFWFFFKLTLPAVAVSWALLYFRTQELNAMSRQILRDYGHFNHSLEILEALLLGLAQWMATWMIFSYLFGALSAATREVESGASPCVSDSLNAVRARIGPFLRISLLLFGIAAALMSAAGVVDAGLLWVSSRLPIRGFLMTTALYAVEAIALLVLSRFGLAIPAVILDGCGVAKSVFRSDELTEGQWSILAALLAKSVIGGYIAGMSPFWLARFVAFPLPGWFHWVLIALSIAAVSAVEPVLFIGFALLYIRMSAAQTALGPAPVFARNQPT
jgi:hypothetical protein